MEKKTMKNTFGKFIALALTATVFTTSVVAQENGKYSYKKGKEEQRTQGHSSATTKLAGGYNAPARYEVQESWDMFVYGEFLYMQAMQDNMVYAVTSTDATRGNPPLAGKAVSSDFEWHPGVIVGFGLGTDFDDWTVNSEWMHYISKNNSTVSKPASGSMYGPQSVDALGNSVIVDDARNTWSLSFNRIDLLLGRPAYIGKNLTIDGLFGIRGAWISQRLNTEYTGVTDDIGGQNTTQINSKWSNWGLGTHAGAKSKWLFDNGFNLFGNAGVSLLGTRQHTSKQVTNPDIAEDLTGRNAQNLVMQVSQDKNFTIKPNAEIGIGLGWGSYFDDDNWHVDLALGYDFHYWWSQNDNVQSIDHIDHGTLLQDGDLQIHGANFTLRFDF